MFPTTNSVIFTRCAYQESAHAVAAVFTDGAVGPTTATDPEAPDLLVCLRSMFKPFQAIAAVRDGVDQRFGLSEAHIAAACGTHEATERHRDLVEELLDLAAVNISELRCGELHFQGSPSRTAHFCAGNHALVLAHCAHQGWPLDTYLEPDHPVQQAAAAVLESLGGLVPGQNIAIDSCGMPAVFAPLGTVARLYGSLASEQADAATARVAAAMRAFPELVGGTGTIDTELMRCEAGVTAKLGAESLFGAGFADGGGFALKVIDGSERAVAPAVLTALRQQTRLASDSALDELATGTHRRRFDGVPLGEAVTAMCMRSLVDVAA